MIPPAARLASALAVPLAVLLAAQLASTRAAALPPSITGLRDIAPYLLVFLGGTLAVVFQRGRAVFALLALAVAWAAHGAYLAKGLGSVPARSVYAALCVFVPLVLGACALAEERGVFNRHGLARLALVVAPTAFAAWLAASGRAGFADAVYGPLLQSLPALPSAVPQRGLAVMLVGFGVAVAAAIVNGTALERGIAGAVAAFGIAAHRVSSPDAYGLFIAAAQVIVILAVLEDAFRMAFRDELTGLPSRRALNGELAALGRRYAIAMIDVDHFKRFNDTYGHDVGDQVLKLVASQLARAGGGGRAYRYGGEEFTLLFPGKAVEDVFPHLEILRESIAGYRMALRGPDRPRRAAAGEKQRGAGAAATPISVTVSIGVAEPAEDRVTPAGVVKAADKALYQAKAQGRNRVVAI